MDTVIVASNQFHSHYPKRIPKGTVNAEQVEIRLDSEWDDLTVIVHWLNVETGVEITPMLERDGPNTIPWEVLDDLGELRMGLIGMDGGVTVKPTIWLTYGYVVDGVDPDGGDDPQEPTPNYLAQMVEQAQSAATAARTAQQAAEAAAALLPTPAPDDAGKILMVNPEGDGYIVGKAGSSDSGQNGTGLSTEASALLITILRNGVYSTDQSANITALETALASGDSGGETEGVAVALLETVTLATPEKAAYYYKDDSIDTAKVDDTTSLVKVNGSAFNWFSDEGTTAYSDSTITKSSIPCLVSKNVFTADTVVKVLIKVGFGQTYADYIIGCTDWDGVSTPSANFVHNCQKAGSGSWVKEDTEATFTVKAGTRLFVASYLSDNHRVQILDPGVAVNAVTPSPTSVKYLACSEKVFNADTTVRIVATNGTQLYDDFLFGCARMDNIAGNIDILFVQTGGDAKWEAPYSLDTTYEVKAGNRLVFGATWNWAELDKFSITEVV